jgi:hypothetical protein
MNKGARLTTFAQFLLKIAVHEETSGKLGGELQFTKVPHNNEATLR